MAAVSSALNPDQDQMTDAPVIQRALISVSDKTDLAEFAQQLAGLGIELYSTGGTREHLTGHGLEARDISQYTEFPEILDGRVKTLHPKVFGGILCRHDLADDLAVIQQWGIQRFELVVVNLYPFQQTVGRQDVTRQLAIENIDIGGPSLVRAAAKNSDFVTIATDPRQYPEILDEIRQHGRTSSALRRKLMHQAFEMTARYDRAIADFFAPQPAEPGAFPSKINLSLSHQADLRYGENSHQPAAIYANPQDRGSNLIAAEQLHGKALSFNNYLDLDAALAIAQSLEEPACAVIKHTNPCGAAVDDSLAAACHRAFDGDPMSAFGSIMGFNRIVDPATADFLATGDRFVEAIIAPDFHPQALETLTQRPKWKKNVRLIRCPLQPASQPRVGLRQIHGGMLVQHLDDRADDPASWQQVTSGDLDSQTRRDLKFAWHLVRFVKSNAIVIASQRALCGVGAGQMSRVDAVNIAIDKAGDRSQGSVLASDAFFPFPDSIELAAAAGIKAIIQPGGSVKDPEVIDACQRHGIQLLMTGQRHFLH